jgi:AcrR family transcriptional regulator
MGVATTKERIKETALRLFLEKGYAVGINEIIRESGTSKGAFYHHFSSKNELFTDTVDEFFFVDYGGIEEVMEDAALSPRSKVSALVKVAFDPFRKISSLLAVEHEEEKVINYLGIIAEYPNYENLKNKSMSRFKKLREAFMKVFLSAKEGKAIAQTVNIDTLSTHLGILIDGAILDSILTFGSVEKSEEICLKSVEQLLDLLRPELN